MESQIVNTAQQTLRLVENSDIYNLIIPEEVQKKIREWCYISHSTEWSGTLFYRPTGSIETKDLVITVADFLVSDIGSAGYTEYDVKPEVITYMLENDLLDCKMGLIHSHNTMAAFFSGTDSNTLISEGNDTAHFVSLIVNNDGKYVARITRKMIEKINGHRVTSYPTFDDGIVTTNEEDFEEENVTYIEYFNLNIVIEENTALKESVAQRYDEIIRNKRSVVQSAYGSGRPYYGYPNYGGGYESGYGRDLDDDDDYRGMGGYPSLFQQKQEEKDQEEKKKNEEIEATIPEVLKPMIDEVEPELLKYHLSPDVLDSILGQVLFGCISFTAESYRKQDKEKWINETMEKVLDRRFGENTKAYEQYMEGLAEVITRNVADPQLEVKLEATASLTSLDLCSICAIDVVTALDKLTKSKPHKYIDIIISSFIDFIYG